MSIKEKFFERQVKVFNALKEVDKAMALNFYFDVTHLVFKGDEKEAKEFYYKLFEALGEDVETIFAIPHIQEEFYRDSGAPLSTKESMPLVKDWPVGYEVEENFPKEEK